MTRAMTTRKDDEPQDNFPWGKVIPICVCNFSEAFVSTSLYPYIGSMVAFFGLAKDDRSLGFYAGLIASSFFASQTITSFYWGRLSDRIGRRPVLLGGLLGVFLSVLVFGCSRSYEQAIIGRSLAGLLSGNVGVSKTYLGEVTTSKTAPRAFSFISLSWNLGGILGPTIGGLLSSPADKYPSIFPRGSLFDYFPFLLPNLVASVVIIFGFCAGVKYLEETRIPASSSKQSASYTPLGTSAPAAAIAATPSSQHALHELKSVLGKLKQPKSPYIAQHDEHDEPDDAGSFLRNQRRRILGLPENNELKAFSLGGHEIGVAEEQERGGPVPSASPSLMNSSSRRQIVSAHSDEIEAAEEDGNMSYFEDAPMVGELDDEEEAKRGREGMVIDSTPGAVDRAEKRSNEKRIQMESFDNENDDEDENFEKESICSVLKHREVVIACSMYALLGFIFTLYDEAFPLFTLLTIEHGGLSFTSSNIGEFNALGSFFIIIFQLTMFARLTKRYGPIRMFRFGVYLALPTFALLPLSNYFIHLPTVIFWFLLSILNMCRCISASASFSSSSLLVNNTVYPHSLGAVNGLGQSLVSVCRSVGPYLGGLLLAASVNRSIPHPSFVFIIMSCLTAVLLWLTFQISPSVDKPRAEADAERGIRVPKKYRQTKSTSEADIAAAAHVEM